MREKGPGDNSQNSARRDLENSAARGELTISAVEKALKGGEITQESFNMLILNLAKDQEAKIAKLQEHLNTDLLTGLPNGRALDEKLPALITRLEYQNKNKESELQTIMLIALDIDRFKFVNDQYGHPKGNEALVVVADRFREVMKEWSGQMVFRIYGGDEFFMVLTIKENLNDEEIGVIFKRIQARINNALIIQAGNEDFHLTLSMGYATLNKLEVKGEKHDAETLSEALRVAADERLIINKDLGRIVRGN